MDKEGEIRVDLSSTLTADQEQRASDILTTIDRRTVSGDKVEVWRLAECKGRLTVIYFSHQFYFIQFTKA